MLIVEVEWDGRKAEANLRKHGIGFAEAIEVFSDAYAVIVDDERHTEPRQVAVGRDATGHILVVVFTWRGNRIRLISARSANALEKRTYQETI